MIFENTHEPIIDQVTFDTVQRIRQGRRRITPMGEMPILSGMVFCADCGRKLYQVRGPSLEKVNQSEYILSDRDATLYPDQIFFPRTLTITRLRWKNS